jgi:hypothetical protein
MTYAQYSIPERQLMVVVLMMMLCLLPPIMRQLRVMSVMKVKLQIFLTFAGGGTEFPDSLSGQFYPKKIIPVPIGVGLAVVSQRSWLFNSDVTT